MKGLVACILSISFFIYNIHKEGIRSCLKSEKVINEQQKYKIDIRDDLIQKYNEIRNRITNLRTSIQIEMRKDTPDWDKIEIMNDEELKLQEVLDEKMSEYKENIRCLQINNKCNKKIM